MTLDVLRIENVSVIPLNIPPSRISLDRDVATRIRLDAEEELPQWKSIRELDKKLSALYQNAAMQKARKEGIARIHLDLKYWRSSKK